jgi:hypothetical protein
MFKTKCACSNGNIIDPVQVCIDDVYGVIIFLYLNSGGQFLHYVEIRSLLTDEILIKIETNYSIRDVLNKLDQKTTIEEVFK